MVWYDPRPYLTYRTTKFILVQEWPVGLTHKSFQILAIFYIFYSMLSEESWAYSEVPMGEFNAWAEEGSYMNAAKETSTEDMDASRYCGDQAYDYAYTKGFRYDNGMCDTPPVYDVATKTLSSVFFSTAILQTQQIGFPCTMIEAGSGSGSQKWDEVEDKATCEAGVNIGPDKLELPEVMRPGEASQWSNGQCVCDSKVRTVYPYQVENMTLHLEHSYSTTEDMGRLTGASSLEGEHVKHPLITKFKWVDGRTEEYENGQDVSISVYDMLKGASIPEVLCTDALDEADGNKGDGCKAGLMLDDENPNVGVDAETDAFPRLRTTGVKVQVSIYYDNKQDGKAAADNPKVRAQVTAHAQPSQWAGTGGEVTYTVDPKGDPGKKTWSVFSKYRQGVLFSFSSTGRVYRLNYMYLVNTLIAGLVLLRFANMAADFHAFYLLPNGASTLLRNKRVEKVSKKSEYAEHGMRAAVAALQFRNFDFNANGLVEAEDIVQAFAKVEGVSALQAHAIATAIFKEADQGENQGSLEFAEYVDCVQGDAISMKTFLDNIGDHSDEPNYEHCVQKFKEQQEEDAQMREAHGGRRPPYTSVFGKSDKVGAVLTSKI